jgi:hypothetical protein
MRFPRTVRLTLLLLLLLVPAAATQAQTPVVAPAQPPDTTPRRGLEVGLNASYVAVTEGGESDMKAAPAIGIFGVFRRGRMVMIQPEAQYSMRRTTVTENGVPSDFAVDYLNLSLLVRMKLFKGLYVAEGPQFSIPVRAQKAGRDIKDNVRSDVSIIIGVGRQFGRMGIEARWDSGLKQIEAVPSGGITKRNRAITGLAIISF